MKIGIDIHGVISENPEFWQVFMNAMILAGHEVHVLSGPPIEEMEKELNDLGIIWGNRSLISEDGKRNCGHFTSLFSIVDYHKSIGTPMKQDKDGQWWIVKMENDEWVPDLYTWDKTKAEYCLKHKIDMMVDDSDAYAYFFKTPYARFYSKNKRKHFVQKGNIA